MNASERRVCAIRARLKELRAELRRIEPYPTPEQVEEALRYQDAGATLKWYARKRGLNLKVLCQRAFYRRLAKSREAHP